jgi:hypothetical protein
LLIFVSLRALKSVIYFLDEQMNKSPNLGPGSLRVLVVNDP